MTKVVIRHEFEPDRLERLSDAALEAADDAGELDGNQHYQDLTLATWDDVRFALEQEAALIRELEASEDPAATEQAIADRRDDLEEREALWHLDVGMASAVMALNALGAQTSLSCNGGVFGGPHPRPSPCIRFYLGAASPEHLLELAKDSGAGLIEEEARLLLYADSVQVMQRFAALGAERFGGGQTTAEADGSL